MRPAKHSTSSLTERGRDVVDRAEQNQGIIPGRLEAAPLPEFGGFTVDGETIAFGPIRTTRMYCADAYRTEQELLKAFREVGRFVITGDRLELLTRDGVTLAVFVAG